MGINDSTPTSDFIGGIDDGTDDPSGPVMDGGQPTVPR